MQNKTRKITRLLAESIRAREIGKTFFEKSGAAAKAARELGVELHTKIGPLPQHKRGPRVPEFVCVVDHFGSPDQTHAYRPARFDRFTVEEYKEPKAPKTPKEAPAPAAAAERICPA